MMMIIIIIIVFFIEYHTLSLRPQGHSVPSSDTRYFHQPPQSLHTLQYSSNKQTKATFCPFRSVDGSKMEASIDALLIYIYTRHTRNDTAQ